MRRALQLLSLLLPVTVFAQLKPGDFVTTGPTAAKRIALTFDDGPGPQSEAFLVLLEKYNVKGTFFMLGEQAGFRPKIARAIADGGHEVASHTFNHTNYLQVYKGALLRNANVPEKAAADARARLVEDMAKSRVLIEKATGRKLTLLRMPHGVDRPWVKEAAKKEGFVLANWTFGADWLKTPEDQLAKQYVKAIKPGAIFLFHDGNSHREKALVLTEAVIKAAQKDGFEIVTLEQIEGLDHCRTLRPKPSLVNFITAIIRLYRGPEFGFESSQVFSSE